MSLLYSPALGPEVRDHTNPICGLRPHFFRGGNQYPTHKGMHLAFRGARVAGDLSYE